MKAAENTSLKNAPLVMPADRGSFVAWAAAEPDGCISAGWQARHPRLSNQTAAAVLRTSTARLVALCRLQRNQTPAQIAAAAGVRTADVVDLENGQEISPEALSRVANVLQLDKSIPTQLFGWNPGQCPAGGC